MFDMPKSEFWDFSLAIYGQPEVSQTCLRLQDDYGANINMLLFACWLGHSRQGRPGVDEWQAMLTRTRHWRERVIRPLRSVRRYLRDEPLAPQSMKENVLKSEFDAEHIEQLLLEREWGADTINVQRSESEAVQDMAANLADYCQADDIEQDDELVALSEQLIRTIIIQASGIAEQLNQPRFSQPVEGQAS